MSLYVPKVNAPEINTYYYQCHCKGPAMFITELIRKKGFEKQKIKKNYKNF